jgi:hypothetical protein
MRISPKYDFLHSDSICKTLYKLGLVLGGREYPVTFAPKDESQIVSHAPLKPVCPVMNTFLPDQKNGSICCVIFIKPLGTLLITATIEKFNSL